MEYNELIKKVIKGFDIEGKPFPQNLMYPILRCDEHNNVMDLFMTFDLIRNKDGSIQTIGSLLDAYTNYVRLNKGEFVEGITSSKLFSVSDVNLPLETSITEFTMLYMKTREFAFNEILTNSQLDILRKIVYIYDRLFEEKISSIYHQYGGEFFSWAYKMLA